MLLISICLLSLISSITAVIDRTHQSNILIVVDAQRCFTEGGSLAVKDADSVIPLVDRLTHLNYFDQVIYTQDWHPKDHVSFASNHWFEHPHLANPKLHRGKRQSIVHRPAQPYTSIVLAYTPAGHLCGYEEVYEQGRSCPGLDLKAVQAIEFNEFDPIQSVDYVEPTTNVTYQLVRQMLWPDHCVADTEGAQLHPQLVDFSDSQLLKKGSASHIDSYSAFADTAHLSRTSITQMMDRTKQSQIFIVGIAQDYCVYYTALDAMMLERFTVTVIEDATQPFDKQRGEHVRSDLRRRGIRLIDTHHIPGFEAPTDVHDDL